jgi:hypothetical protein
MNSTAGVKAAKLHVIDAWSFAVTDNAPLSKHAEPPQNSQAIPPGGIAAQCKAAFEAMIAKMRDIKKRCFLTPLLTGADYISLGLKPHDPIPTPSGVPTAQVTIETYLAGRHELGLRIIYVDGSPTDPANKGYRIWYSVVAPGDASTDAPPPANPDDLRKSFFTKRKKDIIEFDFGDSGKTAYFAVQIENEGKKGPWGPLVSSLIP